MSKELTPPMLYVGIGDRLEYVGIEEAFESGDIPEQKIAIDALMSIAAIYHRGKQLDTDPHGMRMTKQHWWGGPDNQAKIKYYEGDQHRIAKGFSRHPDNWDRLRRDVHTHFEDRYGWPILPSMFDMATYLDESDRHQGCATKKAVRRYLHG